MTNIQMLEQIFPKLNFLHEYIEKNSRDEMVSLRIFDGHRYNFTKRWLLAKYKRKAEERYHVLLDDVTVSSHKTFENAQKYATEMKNQCPDAKVTIKQEVTTYLLLEEEDWMDERKTKGKVLQKEI